MLTVAVDWFSTCKPWEAGQILGDLLAIHYSSLPPYSVRWSAELPSISHRNQIHRNQISECPCVGKGILYPARFFNGSSQQINRPSIDAVTCPKSKIYNGFGVMLPRSEIFLMEPVRVDLSFSSTKASTAEIRRPFEGVLGGYNIFEISSVSNVNIGWAISIISSNSSSDIANDEFATDKSDLSESARRCLRFFTSSWSCFIFASQF
jgi:hypothetical protein